METLVSLLWPHLPIASVDSVSVKVRELLGDVSYMTGMSIDMLKHVLIPGNVMEQRMDGGPLGRYLALVLGVEPNRVAARLYSYGFVRLHREAEAQALQ